MKAKDLAEERASIEFAELAVVPITCRSDKPVSFLPDLLGFAFGDFRKGEFEGVVTFRFQGAVEVLEFGVSAIASYSHPS